MNELTEREAVLLCQTGRGDAARTGLRRLYDLYFDEVRRLQGRLLGDASAADDATQETFVRLHHGLKACDAERPLRPWVLVIARNVGIDILRARQKAAKVPIDELPARSSVVEDASASEERRAVADSLAALAPEHRSILLLRHVHELKLEEIAEGSACTVRTVRNRLRAAGALLGRELKRRGIVSGEVRS